jgi:hypothetical protein
VHLHAFELPPLATELPARRRDAGLLGDDPALRLGAVPVGPCRDAGVGGLVAILPVDLRSIFTARNLPAGVTTSSSPTMAISTRLSYVRLSSFTCSYVSVNAAPGFRGKTYMCVDGLYVRHRSPVLLRVKLPKRSLVWLSFR